jgi:hypothetical protein
MEPRERYLVDLFSPRRLLLRGLRRGFDIEWLGYEPVMPGSV